MNFLDILGQKMPIRILQKAAKNGNYAHAYLFSGPDGVGKKSTAFAFAKLLNCKNRAFVKVESKEQEGQGVELKDAEIYEACGTCISCNKIQKHIHPDVVLIQPEKTSIGIDQIRALKFQAHFKPGESDRKIYIIDESEKMTIEAANSILKLLEEPPDKLLIILITQNIYKLISTVISRCQVLKFNSIPLSVIAASLSGKYKVNEKKALFYAQLSNGSIGKAFSYCEEKMDEKQSEIDLLINKIKELDLNGLFSESRRLSFEKDGVDDFLNIMLVLYRQKLDEGPFNKYQKILEIILNAKDNIKKSLNPRLTLDEMFLEIGKLYN